MQDARYQVVYNFIETSVLYPISGICILHSIVARYCTCCCKYLSMRTLTLILCLFVTASAFAQQKKKHHAKKPKTVTVQQMPGWYTAHGTAKPSHVYFPDYRAFYDANRQGFVFWAHNRWEFSPSVPLYLEKVDLTKSRIQVLNGLSLDLHPEQNYPNYMKLYPAQPTGDVLTVPVPTITKNK